MMSIDVLLCLPYILRYKLYVFNDISSRLLTPSVVRVFYHSSGIVVLGVEVISVMPRMHSKAVPEGNGPVPHHDKFESDPRWWRTYIDY